MHHVAAQRVGRQHLEDHQRLGRPVEDLQRLRNDDDIRLRLVVIVIRMAGANAGKALPSRSNTSAYRLKLKENVVDDDLVPVVGRWVQHDLPVDQLPFLPVGAIVDEGAKRLDGDPVILKGLAHRRDQRRLPIPPAR